MVGRNYPAVFVKPHNHSIAAGNRNYLGAMKRLWTETGNEGFEDF